MAGKVWKISICMMLTVLLCACTGNDMMEKKVRDLDFTVVSAEDISEELKSHIDERKEETFTLIYRDGENMSLILGYGSQEGGGYSIRVNDLYLGTNAVYADVDLLGPEAGEDITELPTTPYIVLKIEKREESVVFCM